MSLAEYIFTACSVRLKMVSSSRKNTSLNPGFPFNRLEDWSCTKFTAQQLFSIVECANERICLSEENKKEKMKECKTK